MDAKVLPLKNWKQRSVFCEFTIYIILVAAGFSLASAFRLYLEGALLASLGCVGFLISGIEDAKTGKLYSKFALEEVDMKQQNHFYSLAVNRLMFAVVKLLACIAILVFASIYYRGA